MSTRGMKLIAIFLGVFGCFFLFAGVEQTKAEQIELTFNMLEPDNDKPYGLVNNMHRPWAAEVEKRTNGRVKIVFYWSGGLGHPIKNYELVEKGVTDMGWAITGYTPGRFPMASVMELPFLFDNGLSGARATWEMYEKFINPEFKDVHVLTLSNTGPTDIITAKKPVRKLEDLKGLRIRAIGAGPTSTMKHLGAAPVAISIVDCYEALQKGTIDGMLVATAPLLAMRLYEVVKYVTEVGIYSESFYYVINKKKWMSISPEDRKIISEISGARLSEMGGRSFDQESDFVKGTILPKAGIEMIRLSKEERERWKKSAAPVDDEWLKDMESKGLPGKKLLEAARQLSEKYSEK